MIAYVGATSKIGGAVTIVASHMLPTFVAITYKLFGNYERQ